VISPLLLMTIVPRDVAATISKRQCGCMLPKIFIEATRAAPHFTGFEKFSRSITKKMTMMDVEVAVCLLFAIFVRFSYMSSIVLYFVSEC
jgi:hypothetical protein